MENKGSDGGGGSAKPAIRFGFSWADEVEREEREQQEQRLWETEREQIKTDPFGAARPREVVLAEKGVDWRARDRELDLHLRTAPRPRRGHKRAAATATSKWGVAVHPCAARATRATPARGAPRNRDAASAGRTPHPRGRRTVASTPPPPTGGRDLPPVSHSAWGGSKRKCAGEGPGPSRRLRPVDDQRRKVFGELNIGEGCASSIRASGIKRCDSGGNEAEGISSMPAVADGKNRVLATEITATKVDGSIVAQKRKGGKKRSGRRFKKHPNQQTPLP